MVLYDGKVIVVGQLIFDSSLLQKNSHENPDTIQARIGTFILDERGVIVGAAPNYPDILGLPAGSFVGRRFSTVLQQMISSGQGLFKTDNVLVENGETNGVNMLDSTDRAMSLQINMRTFNNYTRIDLLQADFMEYPENSLLGLAFEHLPMPIFVVDSQGLLCMINKAAACLLQDSPEVWKGRPVKDLDFFFPSLSCLMLSALYEGISRSQVTLETTNIQTNGYFLLDTMQLTNKSGRVVGGMAILNNPSGSVSSAQATTKGELDLISELAEETVHKVRNPLTTIKGFLQLYRSSPEKLPWDIIDEEISNIEQVAREIQVLSQNHSNKAIPVNINHLLEEMYPDIEARSLGQGVWIELYLDPKPGLIFTCKDKLRVLIHNLVINALNSVSEGGILTLRTLSSKDGIALEVAAITYYLHDNTGERPHDASRLNRADLWSRIEFALCQRLAESLNGSISIKCDKAEGTVISLSLPRHIVSR